MGEQKGRLESLPFFLSGTLPGAAWGSLQGNPFGRLCERTAPDSLRLVQEVRLQADLLAPDSQFFPDVVPVKVDGPRG